MEDGAGIMCVVVVVVCGLANDHSKPQTVDDTKEDNEDKAPVTSSAERCCICVAIISALLFALRKTLDISPSFKLVLSKKAGK